MLSDDELRAHLTATRLAGTVATPPANSAAHIDAMLDGDPDLTFGLSDWMDATRREAIAAVELVAGVNVTEDINAPMGWIDPEAVLDGVERYASALRPWLRNGDGRCLLATGHPMGLQPHLAHIGHALEACGNKLVTPLDDQMIVESGAASPTGRMGVRFLDGVACAFDATALLHTHRSTLMEAMLHEASSGNQTIDLVVADHGMAGAAIEAGIATASIADINDPALPLAHARGHHDALLVLDDNLRPAHFRPVTRAILERATRAAAPPPEAKKMQPTPGNRNRSTGSAEAKSEPNPSC